MPRKKLKYGLNTEKQQAFVEAYMIELNATKAAIQAGYSPKSAHAQGCGLLKNPKVQAAIQQLKDERAERTGVDADRVIKELERIGLSNITDAVTWSGNQITLVDSDQLDEDVTAAIKEVSETRSRQGVTTTIKTHDKIRALTLLCRHLGIAVEKKVNEVTGKDGGPIKTERGISDQDHTFIVEQILGVNQKKEDGDVDDN
jgi:phage terminase small subunit